MANASLLFYDPKKTPTSEVDAFREVFVHRFPRETLVVINFFSSKFEDLQLISKHRVVSLPTFVSVTPSNKVAFRVAGKFPTAHNLELVNGEGTE